MNDDIDGDAFQGTIQQQKCDLDRVRELQMAQVNSERDELQRMQADIDRQRVN